MSLSAALSVALTGLQTSTTAAQLISGNISNAQTAGYTDKSLTLSTVTDGTSLGGVAVTSYNRVSDSVLTATLNSATSNASFLSTQNGYMQQVQSILGSSDSTPALSAAVANFQSAWQSFSTAPEQATTQQSVIAAGQQLASTINTISNQAATLQSSVQSDLQTTVTSLNTDLTQIQSLNTQIAAALGNNQSIVNLQDQRDQVVNSISAITNVQVMQRDNGQIALYTPGGNALIDGQPQVYSVSGNSVVNAIGSDVSGILTGGKMQAQVDFLSTAGGSAGNGNNVVANLQSQLKNFVNMFTNTAAGGFANTYDSATTGTGEQASQFFTVTLDGNNLPDLSTFAVNSNLVNGTTTVKQASAVNVANTFAATNLAINNTTNTTTSTFSAGGLTTQNQTYSGIANMILSGFQQAANAIQTSSTTATTQQTYYKNALSSETGVNTDTELVNLTNWQNSYAASAHVISTIQSMLTTLENMVG
ncbi:MAG: flagellar hook-associated protein FlgK [Alphaproteobacteria bacterium]|nr:flagellar hook-associated protein FlgK [Alphaproteobacteria bacterium]